VFFRACETNTSSPLHRTAHGFPLPGRRKRPHPTSTPLPSLHGLGGASPWFLYAGYGFWHAFCDVGVFHVLAVPGKAEVAFSVYDDEAAGAGGFGAE